MKKKVFAIGCLLCCMPLAFAVAQPANPPPASRPATAPAGPVFAVRSITHDVDYQRNNAEQFTLTLQVTLDPGTAMSEASPAAWVSRAVDDVGNSLAFETPKPQYTAGGGAPENHVLRGISVSLKPPPESAKRGTTLKLLEGQIQGVSLKTDKAMFSVPGGLDKTWGNVRVICGSKTLGDGQVMLGIKFLPTTGTTDMAAFDVWRRRVTRFVVKDAAGNIWKENGRNYGDGVKDEDQTMFVGPGRLPPTGALSASFEVPIAAIPVNIPFKLENIPLP